MQTESTNRFAFVPHIANGPAPNTIYQFRFDENTGRLTPNTPPQAFPGEGAGPRHFCFHPTKNVVYFSNEQGCSVSAYNLDTDKGTLTLFDTVSTLPDGFEGSNSCAQIQISHDGRFVYAPNRGHNSIACFATDPATGGLTRTAIVPSERVPRAVSLDPASRHFYAAGLESGTLACYRVDQSTGVLQHLKTYPVGKAPMWVMILPIV
jgi:6-phosphogluconolactonase